jgi:hypothetical protein
MTTLKRHLPDWLEGYLKYTENSEPPRLFRTWVALSVIAAALKRKCRLPWGMITFFPNMYVVLVAPPGKARKGTAMGPGLTFLNELGIKLAAEATTREALIRYLNGCNDTIVHPDGASEFHASLTIYSEELTVFLGYQNRQLISDLTDWYDCRQRWTYRTKHEGTDDIVGVWVNLLGATTPDMIQTSMPLETVGGGLASRIIFVYEQRKEKVIPVTFLTDEEVELGKELMKDLEQIHILQGNYTITSEFLDLWIDWYSAQEDNPPFTDDKFSGYTERRPAHLLKLSMILNASRTNSMLMDTEDLQRALKILTLTEVKMPYTFGGVGRSNISDVIHKVMVELALQKECTFAHLIGRFYKDVDKLGLTKILESLEAMKFIERTYRDGQMIIICKPDTAFARDLGL